MIITEIQYFFSKIIRFQAIFKDTVEFTCALEFKISSQQIFSSFFRAVVLSRCCLNNESEYIIPHCTCQHYFSNFLHKLSPATSIPHKQGIFAMFLFCFLLFYKERKLLSELFHQICQIVIFIQTCKYSAVSGIIYDHLAQGSQVSEDIKCVYCPNN